MNYMKSLMMAALVLLFSADLWAADVDAAGAQAAASRFIRSRSAGKFMNHGSVNLRLVHTEPSVARAGSADYYVFNAEDNGGFIIVAGDDRARQILAVGDHAIDMEHLPANVQWWLDQYKTQIEMLAAQPEDDAASAVTRPQRAAADIADIGDIAPMLTSTWSQGPPFNDQCPVYQGERSATGCVATAMAQVMYYWKFPDEFPALSSYVTSSLGIVVPELPATRLDWDNMIDSYSQQYTPEQGEAVATLMRYCGQGCRMDYDPEGSAAWEVEQLMALQLCGYNQESECLSRDDFDDEQWNAMILEDLVAGRPVLYTGTSSDGGHAFVLDGYANGMYHVNWGWGGGYDGYYALDALGKGSWQFNYYQTMQYHVYPDAESSMGPTYDFEVAGIYYKIDGDAVAVTKKSIQLDSYSGAVTIPETVTHEGRTYAVTAIASGAFMNCRSLTALTLPATVTHIGKWGIAKCPELKTMDIIGKGKVFDSNAVYDCEKLNAVIVDDVESWCSMTFVNVLSNPAIWGGSLFDRQGNKMTDIVIPASVDKVGDYAFIYNEDLHSVTIEEGVTSIGESAFYDCENLVSLSLPSTLQDIGDYAFSYCEMPAVELSAGLTSIGQYAFFGCVNVGSVDIPGSVAVVGDCAFTYCQSMSQLNLGQGIRHLGDYAFNSCTSLTSVTLPESVSSMGFAVFAYCDALQEVNLSKSMSEIPGGTFYECTALEQIDLPEGVTTLGEIAFERASALNRVTIPRSLTSVGESAFKSCSALNRVDIADLGAWCGIEFADQYANPLNLARHLYMGGEEVVDLVIPDGVQAIKDYAFYRCDGLTSLAMSDGLESIGANAFAYCKNLARATLGDDVRTIGEKAFTNCSSLAEFTFGRQVDSLQMQVFAYCSALTSITSRAMTPPTLMGKTTFTDKTYNRATLRVPKQSLQAYQDALVWKRFVNMEGFNLYASTADVNGDGEVTIADVNCVIDALLRNDRGLKCDVNCDGEVSIADVNTVIDVILFSL